MVSPKRKPGPKPRPLYDRLNEKIDRSGGPDACWPWTGATRSGYGQLGVGAHEVRSAHILAWKQVHGPVPNGMKVLHHCDNRRCCNPYGDKHLFLGTQKTNMQDMVSKGRHVSQVAPEKLVRGEAHPSAVLTEADVREMRRRAAGGEAHHDLAQWFGVSQVVASRAIRGVTWQYVK